MVAFLITELKSLGSAIRAYVLYLHMSIYCSFQERDKVKWTDLSNFSLDIVNFIVLTNAARVVFLSNTVAVMLDKKTQLLPFVKEPINLSVCLPTFCFNEW